MIAKGTANLITNGVAQISGGQVASPWFDLTAKVAATSHIKTELLTTSNSAFIEVRVEVADDAAGTNAALVSIQSADRIKSPVVTFLNYRHAITDRFIRVVVRNRGGVAGATVTVNARIDFLTNIG